MINPEPHSPSAILIRAGTLQALAPGTPRDPNPSCCYPKTPRRPWPGFGAVCPCFVPMSPVFHFGALSHRRQSLHLWISWRSRVHQQCWWCGVKHGSLPWGTPVPPVGFGITWIRSQTGEPFPLPLWGLGISWIRAGWWLLESWGLCQGGKAVRSPPNLPPKWAGTG